MGPTRAPVAVNACEYWPGRLIVLVCSGVAGTPANAPWLGLNVTVCVGAVQCAVKVMLCPGMTKDAVGEFAPPPPKATVGTEVQ